MVVDRSVLTANLLRFYDFKGKSILYTGCGLGQLLTPESGVSSVVGIDRDTKALKAFRDVEKTTWAEIPIKFFPHRFETVKDHADVAYFEFCMHMMDDPKFTLELARKLTKDIVIIDHLPGSKWVYYWNGEEDVRRSTQTIESFGVRRRKTLVANQHFEDGKALAKRLDRVDGEAKRRILELRGANDIHMRMDYALYLL
jgi:SAM-dependent methyltransferase